MLGVVNVRCRMRPSERRRAELCALVCLGVPDATLRQLINAGGLAAFTEALGFPARLPSREEGDLAARATATRQAGASPSLTGEQS